MAKVGFESQNCDPPNDSLRYLNVGILIIRKQLQGAADVAAIGAAHVLGGKNGQIVSDQVVSYTIWFFTVT